MSDDLEEESFRAAAGIPTKSEKRDQEDQKARAEEEWKRNAPKKEQALQRYEFVVVPMINEVLAKAQRVAEEAHHSIVEHPTHVISSLLAWRRFDLQTRPPQGSFATARGGRTPQPAQSPAHRGTLHFMLNSDCTLVIEVSSKQQIAVGIAPGTPIDDVERKRIVEVFQQLLAQLKK